MGRTCLHGAIGLLFVGLFNWPLFSATHAQIVENSFLRGENRQIQGYTEDKEGEWTEPFHFIFATDPQPGLIDQFQGFNGSRWETEINRTEQIVTAINKMTPQPRFLLIGGDIINAYPGEEYRPQQISDIRKAFSGLNPLIPIFVIPGNHDVGNVPTNATMEMYRKEFGDEYYSFWMGGVFNIILNSQCIFNSSMTEDLCNEQDAWLTSQLERAKNCGCVHVLFFMHIPLFLRNVDEENGYFAISKPKRLEFLEDLGMAGIRKVFSGHYHRNAGGVWNGTEDLASIEVIVSSAIGAQLGTDKAGIRVVEMSKDNVKQQYYEIADIPTHVGGGGFKILSTRSILAFCLTLTIFLQL